VALSAINPKNLLMMVGGGIAIANAPASTGGKVIAAAVFVLLAVSTVVLFHVRGARDKPFWSLSIAGCRPTMPW
jgi:hypothetical protein